jgi:3-isopropylmalate/(R)-2-methylmalate dehydratase small subunit
MPEPRTQLTGMAVPLAVPNLDADQIMPKQFLRGTDKSDRSGGLPRLSLDAGRDRPTRFRTQPARIPRRLHPGRSRELLLRLQPRTCRLGPHAIRISAIIAPSFGEIFYSNALNNGLIATAVGDVEMEGFPC